MRITVINIILFTLFVGCGKTQTNNKTSSKNNNVTLNDELESTLSADTASEVAFKATSQFQSPDTKGQQPEHVVIKKAEIEGYSDKVSVEILYLTGDITHSKLTERFILNSNSLPKEISNNENKFNYERNTVEMIKEIRSLKN